MAVVELVLDPLSVKSTPTAPSKAKETATPAAPTAKETPAPAAQPTNDA